MPLLGAHMSIAGGYYKAVDEAGSFGMEVVQIFTKNNNQWAGKPIVDEDVKQFRDALERHQVAHPLSHASYLINLAAPPDELWEKSIEAMVVELQRAKALGVKYVVVHPGAFTTTCEEEGIDRVAAAIDRIHDALDENDAQGEDDSQAQILLENTAGQGSCLGHDLSHLGTMIAKVRRPERVGVCFDTCHAFAAGHGFSERGDILALKRAIDDAFGLAKIRAIHLNDSKREKGSRVDRHEHIGHGHIGIEGFRAFVNDRDFAAIPMYMETPKGDRDGEAWDAINLRTVRELVGGKSTLPKPNGRAKKVGAATTAKKAAAKQPSSNKSAKSAVAKSNGAKAATPAKKKSVAKKGNAAKQPSSRMKPAT